MATVFVINPTYDNINDAERFGAIRYVSHRYLFPDEIDDNRISGDTYARMVKCASEFNPEHDYLLIVGDHLQLVAFTALLAYRHPKFRALRYDRKEVGYFPVWIEPQWNNHDN